MELFYTDSPVGAQLQLTPEDSLHCAKVLRHRENDRIAVVDGKGVMYECRIVSVDARPARPLVHAEVECEHPGWHSHPYRLTMAVCPTKNNDRYEWFVEKATEIGVDSICPVIGERSERKEYKTLRAKRIVVSAAKQSLKAQFPDVCECVSVREFVTTPREGLKFIAYCFEDESAPRVSLREALERSSGEREPEVTVLIGPEGDFSPAEAKLSIDNGYIPIHLGASRLRTETAAVVAASQVYTLLGEK